MSFHGELNFDDFKAGCQDEYLLKLDYILRQVPFEKEFPWKLQNITNFNS